MIPTSSGLGTRGHTGHAGAPRARARIGARSGLAAARGRPPRGHEPPPGPATATCATCACPQPCHRHLCPGGLRLVSLCALFLCPRLCHCHLCKVSVCLCPCVLPSPPVSSCSYSPCPREQDKGTLSFVSLGPCPLSPVPLIHFFPLPLFHTFLSPVSSCLCALCSPAAVPRVFIQPFLVSPCPWPLCPLCHWLPCPLATVPHVRMPLCPVSSCPWPQCSYGPPTLPPPCCALSSSHVPSRPPLCSLPLHVPMSSILSVSSCPSMSHRSQLHCPAPTPCAQRQLLYRHAQDQPSVGPATAGENGAQSDMVSPK